MVLEFGGKGRGSDLKVFRGVDGYILLLKTLIRKSLIDGC